MDLWIRSQDKKHLVRVSSIQIVKVNDFEEYTLTSYNEIIGDFDLGFYKSKRRALEVLDEIQKIIVYAHWNTKKIVYKMPEE